MLPQETLWPGEDAAQAEWIANEIAAVNRTMNRRQWLGILKPDENAEPAPLLMDWREQQERPDCI
jgi:hypothetical protein